MLDWKLNIDGEIYSREHSSVIYALNRLLDSNKNPTSIDEYSMEYEDLTDGDIIGVITSKETIILFSLLGSAFEVGVYKNNTYNIIFRTYHFPVSRNHAIRGVAQTNVKGDTIISWCNGTEEDSTNPCILNLDDLPFKSGINPVSFELNNPDEIGLIKLFPDITAIPNITEVNVLDSSGGLPAGAYYIAIGYSLNPYENSVYNYISNPISIYEPSTSQAYKEIVGSEPGTPTSKAINVRIEDVDPKYKFLNIAVIYKADNVLKAYLKSEPLPSSTVSVKYTTISYLESLVSIGINEVLENPIIYEKIHSLTTIDSKLITGKTTSKVNVNYQKFANFIKTEYVVKPVKKYYSATNDNFQDSYKNNEHIVFNKGFQPNEVYAFYIRLLFDDGGKSEAFHIPGRKKTTLNLQGTTVNEDAIISDTLPHAPPTVLNSNTMSYLQDDSSLDKEIKLYQTRNTSYEAGGIKYMGYWENYDEEYPDDDNYDVYDATNPLAPVDSIKGEKVRHHRMPSLYNLLSIYPSFINPSNSSSNMLGVKFRNINIPNTPEYDSVIGYEILYAKRTLANSIIQDSTVLHRGYRDNQGDKFKLAGHNVSHLQANRVFGAIPFNIMKYKSGLAFSYIDNQAILNFGIQGTSSIGTTPVNNMRVFGAYEDTDSSSFGINFISPDRKIRKTTNNRFINNSYRSDTDFDNEFGQSFIGIRLTRDLTNPFSTQNWNNQSRRLHYADLCMLKRNCYADVNNQELAIGGIFKRSDSIIEDVSGDVFLGMHSYRLTGHYDTMGGSSADLYIKDLYAFPIISPSNIELRFDDGAIYAGLAGNPDYDKERIFPKLGGDTNDDIFEFLVRYTQIDNYFGIGNKGYNFDYTSINNLKPAVIFSIYNPRLNIFPNRVHLSSPNQSESILLGWKRFFYEDYKDIGRERGDITLLASTDDILYIQCQRSLFVDNPRDTLDAQNITVGLQETSVLSRKAKEVLYDNDGQIGCDNMFGAIVTKYGYCVIDSKKGRIYILREGISEITVADVTSYFKLYSRLGEQEYNIFTSGGLMLAYDEEYERLLVCKKGFRGNDKSFTISYHLLRNHFICFHSYVPDYIIGTNFKLYSIKNQKFDPELPPLDTKRGILYIHNQSATTGLFYKEHTTYGLQQKFHRSIIDVMYHSFIESTPQGSMLVGHHFTKILNSITWITHTFDSDGNQLYDETFDKLAAYNDSQCTGELYIKNTEDWYNSVCGKTLHDSWYYNRLKDYVLDNKVKFMDDFEILPANVNKNLKNWFDCSYFIGKFVVARLISQDPNKLVKLFDVHIDYEVHKG